MANTSSTSNDSKNEKTPSYSLEAICGIKRFDEAERYYAKGHLNNLEGEFTIAEWESKFNSIGLPYEK